MRTLEDALDQFAYHPPTPEVAEKYAAMRAEVARLVKNTWDLIPDGPEKTLALRGIQQFLMHANLAIALTTPADYANPHIARELPGAWECASCHNAFRQYEMKNLMPPQYNVNGPVCNGCAALMRGKFEGQ